MAIEYPEENWKTWWASSRDLNTRIQGAILGAGLGSRLDPLTTHHLPKPLFPLGGKVPIAEIWLRRMIESGITDVSMNLCVLADAIKRRFGNGAKFGIDLQYVEEETPSGTLGGVCKMALGAGFKGSTVIVPSGDIVANFGPELLEEMYEIHRKAGAAFTIILKEIPMERRKDFGTAILEQPERRDGVLSLAGKIAEFREKDPNSPSCLNNASIYMIETDLLRLLDPLRTEAQVGLKNPFYDFGKHVFPLLLGNLPYVRLPKDYVLWGIRFDGAWVDVGSKRDYLRVNEMVLDGTVQVPLAYEALPWGYLGSNVSIDFAGVEIRSPVAIGNGCTIERGAVIGPYAVIGDGWTVEGGSEIRHSVLWEPYPFFAGKQGAAAVERQDPQVVRGARVERSIITGGEIRQDTVEKTVDIRADGEMVVLPIDYVPPEPRP